MVCMDMCMGVLRMCPRSYRSGWRRESGNPGPATPAGHGETGAHRIIAVETSGGVAQSGVKAPVGSFLTTEDTGDTETGSFSSHTKSQSHEGAKRVAPKSAHRRAIIPSSPETFAIRRVVARRLRRTWRERACAAPCGGACALARVASPERTALATVGLWGRLCQPPAASARGTGAQRARARIAHSEHKLDRDLRAR